MSDRIEVAPVGTPGEWTKYFMTDCRVEHALIGSRKYVECRLAGIPHTCADDPCDTSRRAAEIPLSATGVSSEEVHDLATRFRESVASGHLTVLPETDPPLLTDAEHAWIASTANLWNDLCALIPEGPSRDADLGEACAHLHGLQNMVLSNAAARAYPDLYRMMGGLFGG